MDKKSNATTERFTISDADKDLGNLPASSAHLLAELVDFLRARGDAQDAGLALSLESQGWGGLTAAQIQILLLQFKALAQADALRLAQVNLTDAPGNVTVTTDGAPGSAALQALQPVSPTANNSAPAPAPTNASTPVPSFAGQIMDLLSRTDLVAPANSGTAPGEPSPLTPNNPSTPSLGSAILNSLTSGQFPGVSAATVVQSNANAPISVPGLQTPSVAAPVTAPSPLGLSPQLSNAAGSSNASFNSGSSNVSVSRMPASDNLGGAAELSNAASITPFVVQKVSTNGSLVSAPVMLGSTDSGNTRGSTSYVQPSTADVLGAAVSITRVAENPVSLPVEGPRPPDPFGNVSLSFHRSMVSTSQGLEGDGSNLDLPRTLREGTSGSGATPVNLVVSRINPLMPDDIPFVITGLNGQTDVINVRFGDTEINQTQITLTQDADGTLRGLVHFEGGETNKVLTINVRQDATVEVLETMSVSLLPGVFGLLLTGNHAVSMDVENDDFAVVSVTATAPGHDGPDANDTLPQVVENTDSNTAYSLVSYTVTRTSPSGHGAEAEDGAPLLADRLDWSVVTTGAGNVSAADIHPSDLSGRIDFAQGEMSRVITIRVLKDAVREDSAENLTLSLSAANAIYSALGVSSATTRIADDDGQVSIARADNQAAREDEGTDNVEMAHTLTFTVTRSNSLMADTFAYSIEGINQEDLLEGLITGNAVSFAAGETRKNITVVLRKDFTVEADETVTVTLSNGTYAQAQPGLGSTAILVANDDKVLVSIAADSAQVVEGTDEQGFVTVTFTVTRVRPDFHEENIPLPADEFDWSVNLLGALSGADVHPDDLGGALAFAQGETETQITVRVRQDAVREDLNELLTVSLDLSRSNIAVPGDAITATALVVDDDGLWRVELASGQAAQVEEGTGVAQSVETITVTGGASQSVATFLPSGVAGGQVLQTAHALRDFDPYQSSFVLGGAWINNDDAVAQVREVVQVSATRMTFWALVVEGGVKAVKVQVDEVSGGLKFSAIAQKSFVNSDPASIANLDTGGTVRPLATSLDTDGYGLHDIQAVFRTDPPVTTSVVVANAARYLPTGNGQFVAGHTLAEFQPYASSFNLGGNYIPANSLPKTVREVDWLSPTSMNFWVSMSDPQYTKAIKIHAEDVVVNGVTTGVRFNVVSGQYTGNNNQSFQALNDFGYGFNNMGVALAAGQNGYGLSGFTAVFANDPENIPTESIWLADDVNYLQSSGALVSTPFTLDQFDADHTVVQIGGGEVVNDALTAQVYQVSDIVGGVLSFWAAAVDEDGTVKAVKISATQTQNGIRFTPVEARIYDVESPHDILDFETEGEPVEDIATRDDANGIGVHHVEAAFAAGEATYDTKTLNFEVTRTNGTQNDTVAYHIEGVQSSDLADPTSGELEGVLRFLPGQFSQIVTITIRQDRLVERHEDATIVLDDTDSLYAHTDPENASATVSVRNDDFLRVDITAEKAATFEGNVDGDVVTTDLNFSVTRTKPAGVDDSEGWPADDLVWTVNDPTGQIVLGAGMTRNAQTGVVSGVLHFDAAVAGTDRQVVALVLKTDRNAEQEGDWRAEVVLSDGEVSSASEAAGSAATWVLDDDPSISVDSTPPAVLEGGILRFTIHRTTALDTAFDVFFQLLPTSGGSNYIDANGSQSVHFSIGQSVAYVDVQTINDFVVNDARQVVLNLTGVENLENAQGLVEDGRVFIEAGSAIGRIENDDATVSIQSIAASSPDVDGMVTFTVTVEREGALRFEHAVTWSVVGAGENPLPTGNLVLPSSRTVSFAPNENDASNDTETFTFRAPAGMIIDGIRTFEVRIQDVSHDAAVANRTHIGVDAARGDLTPNGVSASIVPVLTNLAEGSVNPAEHLFQVRLSETSTEDIVVAWRVQDYASGTALDATASDFVGGAWPSGRLTIAAGDQSGHIRFSPAADSLLELTEKFKVVIEIVSGPAGVVGPASLGSIINDDARIGFAEADARFSVFEGPEGLGAELVAYVNREGFNRTNISVGWHVELVDASDAAAWDDLFNGERPSGRLEILAGQSVGAINIRLAGDNILEASERFKIVLEDDVQGGADLSSNRVAYGVIANDDAVISMQNLTVSDTEGQGGTKTITVTLVRDTKGERLPAADVTWVALPSGTGADYVSAADFAAGKFPSGTVRFAPGANEAVISFTVKADALLEGNESFVVSLTGTPTLQHRLAADANALSTTVTLRNDDDEIAFASGVANLSQDVLEDGVEHGGRTLTYTLTRQGDLSKVTAVQWHLDFNGKTAEASDFLDADGVRYADGDSVVGMAVFAANSNTATVTLRANNDFVVEDAETFAVVLESTDDLSRNGSSLALTNTTATGTLLNDDVGIVATLVGSDIEGDGSNTTFTYNISRDGDLTQASSINWSVTGARLAFNPGNVTMASPLSDDEITSAQTGTLNWASGESDVKTVTVTIAGDMLAEGDEAFKLLLSNALGQGLHPSELKGNGLTGAVNDNDAKIGIQALSTSTIEGREGSSQTLTYEITRTGDLSQTLTVQLSHSGASGVTGPSAVTLSAGDQETVTLSYDDGRPDQTFTLRGDTQRVQVEFTLFGDDILELNEALTVSLGAITGQSAGHNASIDSQRASASTAITNDDDHVITTANETFNNAYNAFVQVEGATNLSPTDPAHTVSYTLTRDPQGSLEARTVNWRIVGDGDTVVNADDFASGQQAAGVPNNGMPSGTVTFAAGATTASAVIVVRLSGDLTIEPTEGLALQLSSNGGNVEFDALGGEDAVLVVADDAGYSITARQAQVVEGNESSGAVALTFDIASVGAPGTIYWKATGITSADVANGQALSGALVFSPLVESAALRLQVRQDSIVDAEKTASITLYSDAAMTVPLLQEGASLVASATLKDDDAEVSVLADVLSVMEGSDPATGEVDLADQDGLSDDFKTLIFEVNRTGNLNQESTVPWSVSLSGGLTVADFYGTFPTTATASGWYDEPNALIKGWITFDAAATAQFALDHPDTVTQTVNLRVKTDWIEESNESVTVQLGQPSTGTSLQDTRAADGSDAASTVVNNDDATVQFATGPLLVTHVEGNDYVGDSTFDGDHVEYQFTVERTGNTDIQSTVTWTLSGAGINTADFEGYGTPDLSGGANGLPFGIVQFGAGETTKTVTVRVKSDDFQKTTGNPIITSKGQSLEADETFTVTLSNGYRVNPSNQGDLTESVGTTVEGRTEVEGEILNDDVQIQITQIRTSLPEGVAPVGGDVNPSLEGVQRYIEQAITFVRQGDPTAAVSFDWTIDADKDLFYHDGNTFDGVLLVNGDPSLVGGEFDLNGLSTTLATATAGAGSITGTVSWAAGDSNPKTLIFRPAGNNDIGGFSYTLSTTSNSVLIDEFTSGTSDNTVLNRGINETKNLARFTVERDEAGVWVSNEVIEQYDPWTSQLERIPQQYSGYDNVYPNNVRTPNDISYSPTTDQGTVEGSLGTATAGLDYSSRSGTLTFTADARVQTITLNLLEDGTFETTEGVSVYLGQTSGASVTLADHQGTVALLDNDGAPVQALRVLGQTAIEGVDPAAQFLIDLGKPVSGATTLNVDVTQEDGTASVNRESGEAGDHSRYFEYSTDGGQTWQTNAPVFDFTYTSGNRQAVDDQLTVAYDFHNEDGDSWDSWLEFSDLKADVAGQRVGNTLTGLSHGTPAPSRIDVVVNYYGGWIDTDGDRYWDNNEREAFDYDGDDRIDLSQNAVSITFIEAPSNEVDLSGFGLDDRIQIDYGRFQDGDYGSCYGSNYVESANGTGGVTWFDWFKGFTSYGDGALTGNCAFAVGRYSSSELYVYGCESGNYSRYDTIAHYTGNDNNLSQQEIFDRVSFVNVGEREVPQAFVPGAQQLSIWIAVRADAAVNADDLSLKISGSGGEMQGSIGGLLDMAHVVSQADEDLRAQFLTWWNDAFDESYEPESDEDWADFHADVKDHFDNFAARLTDAPALQFVQVQVDWDGYGQMSWGVEGLDPTVVLAPQNDSPFGGLQLLQDITVDADTTSASADVALGAQATFDTDNGMSAVAALERDGLQPAFEVVTDETDAEGVRTVTMKVTRPADLGQDVLRYDANFPAELTDARLLSGSDPLSGRVAFADGETEAELVFRFNAVLDDYAPMRDLPLKLQVIVDHNPNDETGAVGAYIDTDRDGVLDADEAVSSNLAFSATGEDLVGVNTRSVTLRINDFMAAPLDLSGFGGDDRIEINLDELGRYWKVGTVTDVDIDNCSGNNDTIRDGIAITSWDLYGRTVLGEDFGISLTAWRESISESSTAYMDFSGNRWTKAGSSSQELIWAHFGSGEGQNPLIDGYLSLSNQISFVKNPTVHVVVDHYLDSNGEDAVGAFIDLDKDGVLDANETNANNLAFNADGSEAGVELRHGSVVLHFNDAPATALNLLNFGRDDRIEIDVGALRDNGWAIPAVDAGYEKAWAYLSNVSGDGAAALVYANTTGGNGEDFLGVHGCYDQGSDVNSIYLALHEGGQYQSAELGTFGPEANGRLNDMVNNDDIWGRVSFVNIDNTPAQNIHVVVDHYDNFGEDAVGAFIDLDQDGVLDDNEANPDNLAFNADGTANIDLATNHVTVQFNDAPDAALDFSGFGADDRIEINLQQFAANGWLIPEKLTSIEVSRDGYDCTSMDISGYLSTANKEFVSLTVKASNESNSSRWIEIDGQKRTSEGSTDANYRLADFSDQFPLIGLGQLVYQQVSFVRDPVVHVVVERDGAYFDLDADGRLDDNEFNDGNLAFAGEDSNPVEGLDLAHQSVVIRFNDMPDSALNLAGFGRDDRIEIDVSRLGLLGALGVNRSYSIDSESYSSGSYDTWSSSLVASQANDSLSVQFVRRENRGTRTNTSGGSSSSGSSSYSSRFEVWYSYSNSMSINGHQVAQFGESSETRTGYDRASLTQWVNNLENPFQLIDANGGMLNRVSFVSSTQRVLVTADGGWIDRDADGVLDAQELTQSNRAFAADGTALVDLQDKSYVLRFLDAPDNALDLSGFNRDDRIEIDRSQLAARGFVGADNTAYSTKTKAFSAGTKMMVTGESGALGVMAGDISDSQLLFMFGQTGEDGTKALLGDFGPDNSTGGEGDLDGRLSFVQSTVHVVVESHGAYLDENANGKLDDNESINVFDPFTGDALIDLRNHKVVIEFNDVPDVALDLSHFGSDDRIEIDRGAFHKAGWGGADVTNTVQDWSSESSTGTRGFNTGSSKSRFVLQLDNGDLSLSAATKSTTSNSGQLGFGLGEDSNAESLLNNNVSFVSSRFIDGFGGDHAISLSQGGVLSGSGMQYQDGDITVDAGTSEVLVRLPVVDDNVDERVETITVSVTTDDPDFMVNSGGTTVALVDNDSPQITTAATSLYDDQLGQAFVVQVVDINNRDGDTPHVSYVGSNPGQYESSSLRDNEAAAQDFTLTLRVQGNWQVALVADDYNNGYNHSTGEDLTLNLHQSPPAFRPVTGAIDERDTQGQLTGYQLVDIWVPAGTQQVLVRLPVDSLGGDIVEDSTAGMRMAVTHVAPVLVVRDTNAREGDGSVGVEVIAVGGDMDDNDTLTVDYSTREGQWEERLFLVSREIANAGRLTVSWSVEALGGAGQAALEDGNSADYIDGYAGHQSIQTVDANDFVLLQNQSAGVGGLPAGTVTFEDGEKEVYIRVAVRTDNVGEEREDFRVVLSQVPAGVSLEPNPVATATFADREHAGYATIANDDQLFVVTGLVFNESFSSKVVTNGDTATGSLSDGMAIAGTPSGMTAPEGYTLHQFIVRREGDARAPASVDWTLSVKGSDVAGFVENPEAAQASGAHAMETADFLTYTSGNYDSALGLSWLTPVAGVTSAEAKTVVFAAGESYKVITLAIKDDAWAEDAETFTVALSNPLALPGNDGNPGVSPLRGEATFVVGDNDGTKVSVALDWLTAAVSASGTAQALQNDLGREASIDNAVYEGTGSDWLTTGDNDYSNSDTSNDRRLQITFTRSAADATASQAFFEISLDQQNSSLNTWVLASSEGTGSVVDASWGNVIQYFWRGTVDFAAGATTANVVFRIPDDNLVEGNQNITVTLYDAEHLPESAWDTRNSFNDGAGLNDVEGIGRAGGLPDWNTTIRDPNAYTATATVVDNDVRLWLGGWQAATGRHDSNVGNDGLGDAIGYDRTPNLEEFDGEPAFTNDVNDPAYGAEADQVHVAQGSAQTGDVELTFVRAGVQAGDIVLNWEVVLDGTATADDFTRLTGTLTLDGGQGTAESTSFSTVIEDLLVADRVVENNETFHLKFTVASIDNAAVGGAANVLFTPNHDKERQGVVDYDPSLNGQASMVVDAVIRNDDLSYGLAWAANTGNTDVTVNGADAKVVEGDTGNTYIDFVVNRALGVDNAQGYKAGSTVAWRVVPVEGSAATVNGTDFVGGVMAGVASFTGWSNTNGVYTRPSAVADLDGVSRFDDEAQLVRLHINPDSKVEYGEHFTIELYDPSVGFVDPSASSLTATLVNDDTGLIINDFKVLEGDSNVDTSVQVTVLRVGDLSGSSDLNWNQYNIDTQPNDSTGATTGALDQITPSSGSILIASATNDGFGVQSQVMTLTGAAAATLKVVGDNTVEEEELFRVKLSKISGIEELLVGDSDDQSDGDATDDTIAALTTQTFVLTNTGATPSQVAGQAYGTVQNDDTVFSVAADQRTVVEDSNGTFTFTITRSVATPQAQTVTWAVLAQGGRNVVAADDFAGGALPTGQVTFAPGQLSRTITVPFASATDGDAEADEVFTVQVTAYGNGAENDTFVVTGVGAKGTIVNDDAAVFISDSRPVVQAEGSSGTRNYLFDVVRSGPVTGDTTVEWELVTNGTASSSDFLGATSGTLTFASTDTDNGIKTVSIGINPDLIAETAETFSIRLKNANGGGATIVGAVSGVGPDMSAVLGDDDFTLTVAPTGSAVESDGRNTLAFVVTRDGNNALPANVTWTLAFAAGANQASASDFRDINDSNPTDGIISGTFVLPSGVDSYTFYVPVQGESQWEENESFTLNMSYDRNNGSALGNHSTLGTITNDDEGFWIEFRRAAMDENSVDPVEFRVVREGNLAGESDVSWRLSAGTATLETTSGNPTDFGTGNTYSGSVSFTGSESSSLGTNGQYRAVSDWISVNLAGDSRFEQDETFTVTLSNPGEGASIKTAQATGTIVNDDMGYSVTVNQATVTEGDGADLSLNEYTFTELVYTITRSSNAAAINQLSTVDWYLSKSAGSATALEAADVVGGALSGRATFNPGETSLQVTVQIQGDGLDEGDSTWRMALNTSNGGGEALNTAQTTVIDDDSTASIVPGQGLTAATEAPLEGNIDSSYRSYFYDVTRSGSDLGVSQLSWQVSSSGARSISEDDIHSILVWTNGVSQLASTGDFANGTIAFADGDVQARQIEVRINQDRSGEYDEQFELVIENGNFGTNMATDRVVQTVTNDDPVLTLSMASTRIAEGNPEADTAFTFLVTRSGDTSGVSSFEWHIEPMTMSSDLTEEDFGGLFPSGAVTFSAGQSQKYVTVLTGGDALVELNENFKVVIDHPVGADILGDNFVDATLVDDDVAVSVRAVSEPLVEGESGAEDAFRFAFTAEGPATATRVKVFWHVEGSSLRPTIGDDFVGGSLPSGETEFNLRNGSGYGYLDILVAGDNVYGPDEGFKVVIDDVQAFAGSAPLGATAVVNSAEALILDDDLQIGLAQDGHFRVTERDEGDETELRFYVDVLGSSNISPDIADIQVNYNLTGDVDVNDFTTPLSAQGAYLSYDDEEDRYYIGMTLKGDADLEDHERFSLRLSSSQDNVDVAAEGATVAGEIRGDDYGIQLATVSQSQWEDSARFTIEVLRMGPIDLSMDVKVKIGAPLSGSGDVASADDFIDLENAGLTLVDGVLTGNLHFDVGQGTQRFTLEAAHDFRNEDDERFAVMVEVTEVGDAQMTASSQEVDVMEFLLYDESSDAMMATTTAPFDPVLDPVT